MKTISYLHAALLLSVCSLWGCSNNCCDCEEGSNFPNIIEQGNLRLIRNWDKLWDKTNKPKELDVFFYTPSQEVQYQKTYADTTNLSLREGEYHILAVNNADNISGTGDYRTAKISVPCRNIDNKYVATTEAPMSIATLTNVFVNDYQATECIISPYPISVIINFRFIIDKDSLVGTIKKCTAELHGVTTSKMLSGNADMSNIPAILQFTTQENSEGIFDKRVSILGLSDKNLLNISIECERENRNTTIDLTNLFDFSLSPVQNCIVRINMEANLAAAIIESVSIEDWNPGEDGNVNLQNE